MKAGNMVAPPKHGHVYRIPVGARVVTVTTDSRRFPIGTTGTVEYHTEDDFYDDKKAMYGVKLDDGDPFTRHFLPEDLEQVLVP